MTPNLIARLGWDGSAFTKGVAGAKAQVAGLSRSFNSAMTSKFGFAALAAGVGLMIKKVLDLGGAMADMHNKTGMTTDDQQRLGYAAEQNGSSLDAVEKAMQKMQMSMVGAAGGNDKKLAAFEKFGVTLADIKSKNPSQLFEQIAKAVGQMGNDASVTDAMVQVMGRSAMELAPMMRDGFTEAIDEFDKLNLKIGPETLATLDYIGDKLVTIGAKIKKHFAEAVAGAFRGIMTAWSAMKHHFGGVAGYLGALSGGASDKEAIKIAHDIQAEIVQESLDVDATIKTKAKDMATNKQAALMEAVKPKEDKFRTVESRMNVDALTKIGGFGAGPDRVPAVERQLERIAAATEETADNTGDMAP